MATIWRAHLHRDKAVIDHHVSGEEVGADCRFVLCTESLVDVLIHQRRLADTAQARAHTAVVSAALTPNCPE